MGLYVGYQTGEVAEVSSELNMVNARWEGRNTPLSYHSHGKLGFSLGCASLLFLDIEGWGWVFLLSASVLCTGGQQTLFPPTGRCSGMCWVVSKTASLSSFGVDGVQPPAL